MGKSGVGLIYIKCFIGLDHVTFFVRPKIAGLSQKIKVYSNPCMIKGLVSVNRVVTNLLLE